MAASTDNEGHRRVNRWRAAAWGAMAGVLLLPLVAMQFTDEVAWTGTDFLFAALLLGGVGLAGEGVLRGTRNTLYRTGAGVALAAAFLLVWINAAVGIIGAESQPANGWFAAVIATALGGACIARFRAAGMAKAFVATALAQVAVAAIALTAGLTGLPQGWQAGLLALTAFFTALWLAAAVLFRQAARATGAPR